MNIWGKKKGGRKTKKGEREKKSKMRIILLNDLLLFIDVFFDLTCFPRLLIICLFHQSSQIYAHAERQVLEGIF